jgi:anaerobic magnesium-protoporphyrin IX monomethyl ester cyclase
MYVLRLAALVKRLNPEAKIILGGAHPSIMFGQMLENPAVDVVVIGEGDLTLLDLVRAIESGDDIQAVRGIAFKWDGRVVKTASRTRIRDLDSLPMPDFYHLEEPSRAGPVRTGISIGRGCPYNCQFCASASVWGNTYSSKSARRVADEIEFVLGKSGDGVIFVGDDMVGVTKADTMQFCEEIMSRGLRFKWYANARVDAVSERLLATMKRAGCVMICYGVESGSPEILKTINKRITVDQVKHAFRLTHKLGIECQATVMVGNPGDNRETIEQTRALLDSIRPNHLWVSYATLYPGTGLYDVAKQQGLIDDSYWASDRVAPVYLGSMALPSMFYHKWRLSFGQMMREGETRQFLRALLSEIKPHRLWAGLNMIRRNRPNGHGLGR